MMAVLRARLVRDWSMNLFIPEKITRYFRAILHERVIGVCGVTVLDYFQQGETVTEAKKLRCCVDRFFARCAVIEHFTL